jgi:hypothetical protein
MNSLEIKRAHYSLWAGSGQGLKANGLGCPRLKQGRCSAWCTAVVVSESGGQRHGVVGTRAEGKAGEVGAPFWAVAGRETHQDGSSTVEHDDRRGSPVAGHRSGGGNRLTAREGV